MWDSLQQSYKDIGGYKSHIDIDDMINDSAIWKVDTVGGHAYAIIVYKGDVGGLRKIVGVASDGSPEGKKRLQQLLRDDFYKRRVFVEASGPFKKFLEKLFPEFKIPSNEVKNYLGQKIIKPSLTNEYEYTRLINGEQMIKTVYASIDA